MRGMRLTKDLDEPGLIEANAAKPQPGPSELQIRVHATGVTPTEVFWYPTWHTETGGDRAHAIPGHEFSGVVAAVGSGVTEVAAGDEVYGMNDWFWEGATAEYCLTRQNSVAPKPAKLSHTEAASVPIGALTAWQGLFDRARLQTGDRVLIQGGAGGVGVFAIQFARSRGAYISTTSSPRNFDFVKELGADEVIDYNTDYFERHAGHFDVVFDVLGGDILQKSWSLLKPGGRMVTIAAQNEKQLDERTKQAFFIVEPDQAQLVAVARLLDAGRLIAVVDKALPFDQAPDAYAGRAAGRSGRGKIVIDIANDSTES